LEHPPLELMKNNGFARVPYMIGVNNTEGHGMEQDGGLFADINKQNCQQRMKDLLSTFF